VAALGRGPRRVQAALEALGLPAEIRTVDESTHTAPQAAAAVGCELGAIVKSLVFRGTRSGDALLVLVSGANRADEALVEAALGEPVERADADFVRAATGYAIGGVAPVGHPAPLGTAIDADLLAYGTVWAAAGTPRAVFPVAPEALVEATGGIVAALGARPGPERAGASRP
jgi:prolyl-tRNA editing enzyme YbaK/EbsC (Cys-tRNA(Pro) deacylase)